MVGTPLSSNAPYSARPPNQVKLGDATEAVGPVPDTRCYYVNRKAIANLRFGGYTALGTEALQNLQKWGTFSFPSGLVDCRRGLAKRGTEACEEYQGFSIKKNYCSRMGIGSHGS
nr:hypothetical protein Iba_chr10bCG10540 [Ipomoea batatas]